MYIEYPHNSPKELLKEHIDKYVSKLNKLELNGNFRISGFSKSWNNNELLFSLLVKQSFIERRLKGLLQIKDDVIIIEFEMPDIVKNFVREEKLKHLIEKHLDNVVEKTGAVLEKV